MLKSLSNPHEYGPFPYDRISLSEAVIAGGGIVAGRWDGSALADMSMRLELRIAPGEQPPDPFDLISGSLWNDGGAWTLSGLKIFARSRTSDGYSDAGLFDKRGILAEKANIINTIREYFRARDFLECQTPIRVVCPATEPHLTAFSASASSASSASSDDSSKMYLATSPELHLKRMIAAGYERIFEITHSFRVDERGRHHRPEFAMLEWYRAWAGLRSIRNDCEELVDILCISTGKTRPARPFAELGWRDAFLEYAGLDPYADEISLTNPIILKSCRDAGISTSNLAEPADILDALFASLIEPELAKYPALFLTGFPACPGALSRTVNMQGHDAAGRFELYLGGVEIANAFDELTDPDECTARMVSTNRQRTGAGLPAYPVDMAFLGALYHGMPPSAGIALGIDRLVMWLTESRDIGKVIAFP